MKTTITEMATHTQTTNGVWVSKVDYDKASNHYMKGLLSSEEVEEYLKLCEEYEQTILDYHQKQLTTLQEKETFKQLVNRMMKKEEEHCLEQYNKSRKCLTLQEHINVMKRLSVGLERKPALQERVANVAFNYNGPVCNHYCVGYAKRHQTTRK